MLVNCLLALVLANQSLLSKVRHQDDSQAFSAAARSGVTSESRSATSAEQYYRRTQWARDYENRPSVVYRRSKSKHAQILFQNKSH